MTAKKKKVTRLLSREAQAREKAYRERRKGERRAKKKNGADRRVYVKFRQLVLGD